MLLVLRSLYFGYKKYLIDYQDPRNGDNFLVKSPLPVLTILICYFTFVKWLGPKIMADRKPFNLKSVMFWYNIAQVFINIYTFTGLLRYSYFQKGFDYKCLNHTNISSELYNLVEFENIFFWSRIFDLTETIIFILRKRDKQASFLHVYHHTVVVSFEYLHNKFFPGTHYVMLLIVNSFVHSIMYGYYAIALKLPNLNSLPQWKQRLTDIQMVQFVVLIIHFSWPILLGWPCSLPKICCLIAVMQNLFMCFLFSDFYKKTYKTVKKLKPIPDNNNEHVVKSKGKYEEYAEKLLN